VQATTLSPIRRSRAEPYGGELCSVNNADCTPGAKIEARGWCSLHYQRWQAHGDPEWRREPRTCPVNQDCTVGGKLTRGLCDKHYWRLRKHGDPLWEPEVARCDFCGGPLLVGNRYGICGRNPDCKRERNRIQARARHQENPGRSYEINKRFRDNHPFEARIAVALNSARGRARKNGVPFRLKKDDLPPMPAVCPVLGIEMVVWGSESRSESPSLDRIVPERGYVAGNVRWISTRANILRRDASARELALVAQDALELEGLLFAG
jgi:hypothetical protein